MGSPENPSFTLMESLPPEPYRIKMVEPIRLPSREEREEVLKKASYNVFRIPAEHVFIDLLTDSGTGAMSHFQWSALLRGDESYAGAQSWYRLREILQELTGKAWIFPVHQGRAAERILMNAFPVRGKVFVSNGFFDTTRANLLLRGAHPIDCPSPARPSSDHPDLEVGPPPFPGDLDLATTRQILMRTPPEQRGAILLTLTSNTYGGVPVSFHNIQQARALADAFHLPLWMDIARLAENCWFIARYEHPEKTPYQIAREICRMADVLLMSAKKDGLVNIGGFLALDDPTLAEQCRRELIAGEGFTDYGGLAGRDLEALAVGLQESFDFQYLSTRIAQVRFLASLLEEAGLPVLKPIGGHAVYVDAGKLYQDQIPPEHLPASVLTAFFYLAGGIRVSDLGTLAFGKLQNNQIVQPAPAEVVRLALPRRVYTESHLRYVGRIAREITQTLPPWKGFRIVDAPDVLAHFTARLEPLI